MGRVASGVFLLVCSWISGFMWGQLSLRLRGRGHAWACLLGHDCVKTAEILENLNWTQGVVKPGLERMS